MTAIMKPKPAHKTDLHTKNAEKNGTWEFLETLQDQKRKVMDKGKLPKKGVHLCAQVLFKIVGWQLTYQTESTWEAVVSALAISQGGCKLQRCCKLLREIAVDKCNQ